MPKVFAAGHIVQFADNSYSNSKNPDGFVLVDNSTQEIFRKHWPDLKAYTFIVGLNTGGVLCEENPQTAFNHCHRIKGVVKKAKGINYPKQYTDYEGQIALCTAITKNGINNGNSCTWVCEREKGHPGDHMAWEVYPHQFYKGGVWASDEAEPAAEVATVTFDDDDIPF